MSDNMEVDGVRGYVAVDPKMAKKLARQDRVQEQKSVASRDTGRGGLGLAVLVLIVIAGVLLGASVWQFKSQWTPNHKWDGEIITSALALSGGLLAWLVAVVTSLAWASCSPKRR